MALNMTKKERIDTLLVKSGLAESRQKAQAEIMAGNVFVNDTKVVKSGAMVDESSSIRIKEKFPYVGRGALKLLHALKEFSVDLKDKIAIDIGSSTGGFTQALLENGARLVYAVDSGTNQLDWKIRSDPRVISMENTNAKYIDGIVFDPAPEVGVVDVSFISVTKILEPLVKILKPDFRIIILLKPQFELDRSKIGRKGLVKEGFGETAIKKVLDFANSVGLEESGLTESPITGAKSGNVEYLVMFKKFKS